MTGADWPDTPSPAFIYHRLLRFNQLCPGAPQCPEVLTLDPYASSDALPCPLCPVQLLQSYMVSTMGQLISSTIDLDFALQSRMQVDYEQISYPEMVLLRVLAEQREIFRVEEMKKPQK